MANTVAGPGSFSGPGNFTAVAAGGGGGVTITQSQISSPSDLTINYNDGDFYGITSGLYIYDHINYAEPSPTQNDYDLINTLPNGSTFQVTATSNLELPVLATFIKNGTATAAYSGAVLEIPVTFVSGTNAFTGGMTWTITQL
jgi:hypothetical protein